MDLFLSKEGIITKNMILNTLLDLDLKCDYLFVHSGLNFGIPLQSRKDMLGALADIFMQLEIRNLIFPSFTFSFCNNDIYSIAGTPSYMGALSEFFRRSGTTFEAKDRKLLRSIDPLLSVVMLGEDLELIQNISNFSCGENSVFDNLHKRSSNYEIKFLFFGVSLSSCFTYSHYVECKCDITYRYDKNFSGTRIELDGRKSLVDYILPVRYFGVNSYADDRLNTLLDPKHISLGDSFLEVIDETSSYKKLKAKILNDPNFMIDRPFNGDKNTTFIYEKRLTL